MTMDTSKLLRLPRKLQHIFWKRNKSIAPATQNDFRHVPEHVWMSRSATPATRNEATRRLKPPKRTTSAKLPIGTAIRSSRERLRTVADGCDRERNVERTHPQPPDPQSETGTLATHSGKTLVDLVDTVMSARVSDFPAYSLGVHWCCETSNVSVSSLGPRALCLQLRSPWIGSQFSPTPSAVKHFFRYQELSISVDFWRCWNFDPRAVGI